MDGDRIDVVPPGAGDDHLQYTGTSQGLNERYRDSPVRSIAA
jgi:hypothetical protein